MNTPALQALLDTALGQTTRYYAHAEAREEWRQVQQRLEDLERDNMVLRNHLREIATGKWGEGSRSMAALLADDPTYPEMWHDAKNDVMQSELDASNARTAQLEAALRLCVAGFESVYEAEDCGYNTEEAYKEAKRLLEKDGGDAAV